MADAAVGEAGGGAIWTALPTTSGFYRGIQSPHYDRQGSAVRALRSAAAFRPRRSPGFPPAWRRGCGCGGAGAAAPAGRGSAAAASTAGVSTGGVSTARVSTAAGASGSADSSGGVGLDAQLAHQEGRHVVAHALNLLARVRGGGGRAPARPCGAPGCGAEAGVAAGAGGLGGLALGVALGLAARAGLAAAGAVRARPRAGGGLARGAGLRSASSALQRALHRRDRSFAPAPRSWRGTSPRAAGRG